MCTVTLHVPSPSPRSVSLASSSRTFQTRVFPLPAQEQFGVTQPVTGRSCPQPPESPAPAGPSHARVPPLCPPHRPQVVPMRGATQVSWPSRAAAALRAAGSVLRPPLPQPRPEPPGRPAVLASVPQPLSPVLRVRGPTCPLPTGTHWAGASPSPADPG